MGGHLSQAVATGVDVVWWTEHDWRMQSRGFVTSIGFDGLSETRAGQPKVTLKTESSGSLSAFSGSFVSSPVSGQRPRQGQRAAHHRHLVGHGSRVTPLHLRGQQQAAGGQSGRHDAPARRAVREDRGQRVGRAAHQDVVPSGHERSVRGPVRDRLPDRRQRAGRHDHDVRPQRHHVPVGPRGPVGHRSASTPSPISTVPSAESTSATQQGSPCRWVRPAATGCRRRRSSTTCGSTASASPETSPSPSNASSWTATPSGTRACCRCLGWRSRPSPRT